MAKAKGLAYGICAAIMLWVIISIVDVQIHNSDSSYEYSKANAIQLLIELGEYTSPKVKIKHTRVVDCDYCKVNGLYEVVCRDTDGNDWAYWSDTEMETNGYITLYIRKGEVIDAK